MAKDGFIPERRAWLSAWPDASGAYRIKVTDGQPNAAALAALEVRGGWSKPAETGLGAATIWASLGGLLVDPKAGLAELAQIEPCSWARTMLRALEDGK